MRLFWSLSLFLPLTFALGAWGSSTAGAEAPGLSVSVPAPAEPFGTGPTVDPSG